MMQHTFVDLTWKDSQTKSQLLNQILHMTKYVLEDWCMKKCRCNEVVFTLEQLPVANQLSSTSTQL